MGHGTWLNINGWPVNHTNHSFEHGWVVKMHKGIQQWAGSTCKRWLTARAIMDSWLPFSVLNVCSFPTWVCTCGLDPMSQPGGRATFQQNLSGGHGKLPIFAPQNQQRTRDFQAQGRADGSAFEFMNSSLCLETVTWWRSKYCMETSKDMFPEINSKQINNMNYTNSCALLIDDHGPWQSTRHGASLARRLYSLRTISVIEDSSKTNGSPQSMRETSTEQFHENQQPSAMGKWNGTSTTFWILGF